MPSEIDLSTLDKRIAERLVRKGDLSERDWEKAAKALADSAEKSLTIETRFEAGVAGTAARSGR